VIRVAIVAVVCGCGRIGFDAVPGDGSPDDVAIDVPGDTSTSTDCWDAWKSGAPVLTAPMLVSELATVVNDHDFVISPDGLTAYFVSNRPGGPGQEDVFVATRTSPTTPFSVQGPVAALSSTGNEGVFYLLPDQLTGYLTSDRVTAGQHDIFRATRSTVASPFVLDQAGLSAVNDPIEDDFDVFPTPDGLGLYFGRFTGVALDIVVARRPDTNQAFGSPIQVAGIDSAMTDTDPTLSPDELVIAFTSTRGGVTRDMYFATRTSKALPFDPPQPIPGNSPNTDQDTAFAADGCELWFASTRAGGTGDDVYVMRIVP